MNDPSLLSLIIAAITAVSLSVVWIETRFRQTRREWEEALDEETKVRATAVSVAVAEHKEAAARFAQQAAGLTRDLSNIQLTITRELRDYPTKRELESMFEAVGEQIDKLEHRLENSLGMPRRIP